MNISALAIAAGLGLALASPATAASDVVSRYAQWEHHLRERVNDLLVYPLGAGNVSGDVLVGFRIGRNGKPANIVVRRTSGQPIFDRAAIMLVSRLAHRGGPIKRHASRNRPQNFLRRPVVDRGSVHGVREGGFGGTTK